MTSNPSGVTGSGDDASALRIMNEIGPKIASGTAIQEQAELHIRHGNLSQASGSDGPGDQANAAGLPRDPPQGFPAPPGLGVALLG